MTDTNPQEPVVKRRPGRPKKLIGEWLETIERHCQEEPRLYHLQRRVRRSGLNTDELIDVINGLGFFVMWEGLYERAHLVVLRSETVVERRREQAAEVKRLRARLEARRDITQWGPCRAAKQQSS